MEKKKYYLAYGSNLNIEQMAYRCPGATAVGVGTLEGWQLRFRGSGTGAYLTIEPCEGSSVPVGIWEITEADERSLDRYEGFPHFYLKRMLRLVMQNYLTGEETEVEAMVYIMRKGSHLGVPSPSYVETCLEGCLDFYLDTQPLMLAVARARREVRA